MSASHSGISVIEETGSGDNVDKKLGSRKRRRSERIKVQSTIPTLPNETVSSNAARVSKEIKEIETSINRKEEGEEGAEGGGEEEGGEEEEEEEEEGGGEEGSSAPKKKKYWKERGYDELSKIYRVFTQYEKSLFAFVGKFSEFAYKVYPFWLGRSHIFETKQKAMEYLINDVTASAIAHGNAIRNMRGFLENLPFHPGSFRNGNQILTDHPTQEYTTKRIVNSLKRCGELICMDDPLKDLKDNRRETSLQEFSTSDTGYSER